MLGNIDNPGLLPYSLHDLFAEINESKIQKKENFKIFISYLEIYNEQVFNLFLNLTE